MSYHDPTGLNVRLEKREVFAVPRLHPRRRDPLDLTESLMPTRHRSSTIGFPRWKSAKSVAAVSLSSASVAPKR